MTHVVRRALEGEAPALASLWFHAWREAHLAHAPEALTRIRTLSSFEERLRRFGPALRVVGPVGAPLGLCVVKSDELNQLFTSPEARGKGVAQALIADAEARVMAAGYDRIWLDVLAENERAIRSYEKSGWRRRGEEVVALDTLDEPFELKALIMEKALG